MTESPLSELMIQLMNGGRMMFTLWADMYIKEDFYNKAKLVHPMEQSVILSGFGSTSVMFDEHIIDAESGETLLKETHVFVMVDYETRRPVAPPKELLNSLPEEILNNKPAVFPKIPKPAGKIFTYSVRPEASDTDIYRHTTRAVYLRFCMDCANLASLKGTYSGINGDIGYHRVRNVKVLYLGESSPGDCLDICTWEDPKVPLRIYFLMFNGRKVVCNTIMDFYKRKCSKI